MKLEELISKDKIRYNESMKKHTTMRVGGEADILVIPESIEDIITVIKYAKENNLPIKVLGHGSNVVVSDKGISGIVLKITNKFEKIDIDSEYINVTSGASMPKVAIVAKQNSLSGFEFACGIPGTIGGGVRMNAGAYGSQISDVLVSVKYLDDKLNVKEISAKDCNFSYRHSIFAENKDYVILEARFKLEKEDIKKIQEKMDENIKARKSKQPLEYPSAGSVFKRPEGYFVGKLVTDANLKGVCVGDAMVSEKHAGFIINIGNATCEDIKGLIKKIQDTVLEKFNVKLETEVEFIGREN